MRLASLLPEFEVVMSIQGAGEITGPQIMAEIGDVRRFTHKGALLPLLVWTHRLFNLANSIQSPAAFTQNLVPNHKHITPTLRSSQPSLSIYGQETG